MPSKIDPRLTEQFVEAAQRAVATVERIPADGDALNKALLKAITDEEAVLLAEPDDLDPALLDQFKTNNKVIEDPSEEQLANIKTGISDSFGAVARTGSVCVSVSNKMGSPVSLFTRNHIAIVRAETIVPNPRDILSADFLGGKGLERSFTFITGPSATADMGPLVRGVHGPGKLHIIILE